MERHQVEQFQSHDLHLVVWRLDVLDDGGYHLTIDLLILVNLINDVLDALYVAVEVVRRYGDSIVESNLGNIGSESLN